MANLTRLAARFAGLSSVALGGVVLARPVQLGKMLGIDTTKQAGKVLTYGLAVRDIAIGVYIMRAKDVKELRQGMVYRLVAETSDLLMTGLGWGIIRQPAGRKIAATIPPIMLTEWILMRKLKD